MIYKIIYKSRVHTRSYNLVFDLVEELTRNVTAQAFTVAGKTIMHQSLQLNLSSSLPHYVWPRLGSSKGKMTKAFLTINLTVAFSESSKLPRVQIRVPDGKIFFSAKSYKCW